MIGKVQHTSPREAERPEHHQGRSFRFSLRTLLLFVVFAGVLASLLGWWLRRLSIETAAVAELQKRGASVSWSVSGRVDAVILVGAQIDDADLEPLQELSALKTLNLAATPISDDAIETLEELEQLEFLSISGTQITPQGLQRLQAALPDTKISTVGLPRPGAMPPGERLMRSP